ncbi:MAG: 50S ribosomal protein L22 [Acidimicrobiaceae bacterium]|nr:50S ribosomal protein L22 [Acidimicrobiaceae bacterium]MBT5205962.1 50S ribosomal protein L22 [Acidimicrobiaceae bacterium]MBT5567991.1 50S ribosomal protein L22 [Acidimicrobiaceae bacterium]MBT6092259.1 50S ribosomal protein L22 [Acidimicrobiaceae bacterium]
MVAVKTNERPGTRAVARYVRVSASKAREVLNLVRGESYGRAAEILAFSERSVSDVVGKLLESAVANAENNDGIPAEELFVSTCYADEGPTLKRWRPRARGRATQILKRTCHITIIVTRYDEATLETMRELDAAKGRVGSNAQAADARRQRVERSRATAAEEAAAEEAAAAEAEHDHDHDHEEVTADAVASEGTETALEPDADEASDVPEESVAQDGADVDGADESADDSEKGAN